MKDFLPSNIRSRSLESFEPRTGKPVLTPDGSKFYTDQKGDILYAKYSTGAIVSIQPTVVTARSASGDHWVVSSGGLSFRVD